MLNSIQNTRNSQQNYRPNFGMIIDLDKSVLKDSNPVLIGQLNELCEYAKSLFPNKHVPMANSGGTGIKVSIALPENFKPGFIHSEAIRRKVTSSSGDTFTLYGEIEPNHTISDMQEAKEVLKNFSANCKALNPSESDFYHTI